MTNKANMNIPSKTSQFVSKDKLNKKNKVDINILLNRIRADKKKEKLESILFFGFISMAVIVTGIIVSF